MPSERYFADLSATQIELFDQEFRHLVQVMRGQIGERVELIDGKGTLAIAQIERIEKKSVLLSIIERMVEPAPARQVILAQAIPRINRLDFILEKGTELGMTQLWLFPGQHSERKEFSENQLERMQSVTIASIKQCGRLYLPEIKLMPPLAKWTSLPCSGFFGDLNPAAPLFCNQLPQSDQSLIFFIGPESGFSEKEEQQLLHLGAKGVRLHHNILRTDTAGLVALSLVTHSLI